MLSRLKRAWKELTLLSVWLSSVIGVYVIPLPSWTFSAETSVFYSRFILLFATIIAGFLVLFTFRNKNISTWKWLTIAFFIPLVFSYLIYSIQRERKTLPYDGKDVVIGDVRIPNNPLDILEKKGSFSVAPGDILKHVHGESERIWTKKSIDRNRIALMLMYTLTYTFFACLIIAFSNLILLHYEHYKNNS